MSTKAKQILFATIGVVLFSIGVAYAYQFFNLLVQIFMIILVVLVLALFCISIILQHEKLYKTTILIVYFSLIALIVGVLLIKSGILAKVNSVEDTIALVKSYGTRGKLVFIMIQFLQVTFIPIPSAIVTAAGAAIYSPFEAILLSCIGLLIGSILAFFLGRVFGIKLVKWIVGDDALNKYYKIVQGKDKAMLIYMFIFPAFPDDVLCLFAGLTDMSYITFIAVQLISRPLNVAMTVFLIDKVLAIPLSGYGIAIWIVIIAIFVVTMLLMWKYAARIEQFMLNIIAKITRKNKTKPHDTTKEICPTQKVLLTPNQENSLNINNDSNNNNNGE